MAQSRDAEMDCPIISNNDADESRRCQWVLRRERFSARRTDNTLVVPKVSCRAAAKRGVSFVDR